MKKTIFVAGLFLSFLISCGQSSISYNDSVVNLYDKFITNYGSLESSLGNEQGKEQKVKTLADFETFTDSCITVMNGLEAPAEAKGFHDASLNVYQYMKKDYIPVAKKMAEVSTEDVDAYNKVVDEYNAVVTKGSELEDIAIAEQQKFAAQKNMELR